MQVMRVVDRAAALARLLRLLESARPADVRAVVSALPEADLAAAVEAAQGRISLPIREYILDEGPSSALIALSRQAVLGRGEATADAVDRVLLRFDPVADAAFFGPLPSHDLVRRARRVILRDRKGPDGRAVIPPSVKQSLLASVAAAEPDKDLLAELAGADDPDLVLAVLPYAGKLAVQDAVNAIVTLDVYGLRAEARRHRGLWAGRGHEFSVLGFRRFTAVSAKYAPDTAFSRTPNIHFVDPVSLEEYRKLVEEAQGPPLAGFTRMRAVALASLRAGTVSPVEVLEHTRPAAATVSLAVSEDVGDERPGDRRAADDMRALIAQSAAEHLGDDVKRWAHAVTWVNSYGGTLLELLAGPVADRDRRFADDYGSQIIADLDAGNVLLAVAPRDIAGRALVTKNMKRTINALAGEAPLCRALVEHIVTRGTVPQREALAANDATPDSVLDRLLEKSKFTDIPFAIIDRDEVGPEVVSRAYAAAPRGQKLREWMIECARYSPTEALAALRTMTDDPAWLLSLLRVTIDEFDEPEEIAAHALLADVAGPEAVWAFDLDRSGNLDEMEPYIRESMATGDAEPIYEAARAMPARPNEAPEPEATLWPRTDAELDHPLNRPLENLVRSRLDGHVERWLELADRLAARPEATDAELIGEFAR